MLSPSLLPLLSLLLPTTLAFAIPTPNNTLTPRHHSSGSYYDYNYGCTYHTNVRQQCEAGGQLATYVYLTPPVDDKGTFTYFDGRPTFGVAGVRYQPGVTQKGPQLWENYEGRFESTWYGDHMWYSYHGPSWSDDDPNFCKKGDWTAGPLECDKPGTLGWRTYDTDCVFKCIW
ncbi:hypothetical protein J1614_008864 [Plenodomus biglobosus]|nr:hypothetical protein J1614_008864 [Plenodomus biglobosus]